MSKLAVLDLDDTLGDLKTPMMHCLNSHHGKKFHWGFWSDYVNNEYSMDFEDFKPLFYEHMLMERMDVHHHAKELSEFLKHNGYTVIVITARGWRDDARDISEQWLNNNQIQFDDLIITNMDEDKSTKITGKVDIIVDDNVKNCKDFIKKSDRILLYNAPWNRNCKLFERVHSMYQTINTIKGIT